MDWVPVRNQIINLLAAWVLAWVGSKLPVEKELRR